MRKIILDCLLIVLWTDLVRLHTRVFLLAVDVMTPVCSLADQGASKLPCLHSQSTFTSCATGMLGAWYLSFSG